MRTTPLRLLAKLASSAIVTSISACADDEHHAAPVDGGEVADQDAALASPFPCLEPEPAGSGLYRCQGGFIHRPAPDACTDQNPVEACQLRAPDCTSDEDCHPGLLCISVVNTPLGNPDPITDLSYLCQKPEDECAGDGQCATGEHCLLGHGARNWRVCQVWDAPLSTFPGL